MSNKNKCEFQLAFPDDEFDALEWLNRVINSYRDNPEHKNYEKAANLACAINRIQEYCRDMHNAAHALENKNVDFKEAVAHMTMQPWGHA